MVKLPKEKEWGKLGNGGSFDNFRDLLIIEIWLLTVVQKGWGWPKSWILIDWVLLLKN